jgi:hypothetical protein
MAALAVGGGGHVEDHRRHGEVPRHDHGDSKGFEAAGELGFGLCDSFRPGDQPNSVCFRYVFGVFVFALTLLLCT